MNTKTMGGVLDAVSVVRASLENAEIGVMTMYKKVSMSVAALVLLGLSAGQATANSVSFVEGTSLFTGGASPITLTLQGTFTDVPVTGGDMIISWTASVLELQSASAATGWTLFADTISPGINSLGFSVTSAVVPNSGTNQVFASFSFSVVGAVNDFSEVVTISDNIDFTGWSGITTDGVVVQDILTNYSPITVTVTTPVPVPAAAWLFGSGLLGMVAVARRRKSLLA